MNKLVVQLSLIPILAIASLADAQDTNGITEGSRPVRFEVTVFTGKAKNTTVPTDILFSDRLRKKPTVLVFTRGLSEELKTYLHNFDEIVKENGMVAAVVVLPKDENARTKLKAQADEWKWEEKYSSVTLSAFVDDKGPPEFAIKENVAFKIVMSVDNTIKVVREYSEPKQFDDAIPELLNASYTILE